LTVWIFAWRILEKKKSVQKSLEEAKTVITFIYNHIWTVNLMKKYTGGREIVRPNITRFATKFLQLQAIVNQKQGLKQMFNSEEFKKSKFYKQKNGPALEARKIVLDHEFWSRATDILKVFEHIVKLLLFRNKSETFDTPQAQAAWSRMNPEDDPLSEWTEERENPALDGAQNAEWLPIIDIDDENENMEVDSDNVGSDENSGGLSPPSDDGGNDGGNFEAGGSDDKGEQMHNDPYEEMPLHRRDHNLIDVTIHRSSMIHSSDSCNGNSRTKSQSRKGKKK
ncbi:hypothetical protein Lal_00018794, partial [Lupinus albus]